MGASDNGTIRDGDDSVVMVNQWCWRRRSSSDDCRSSRRKFSWDGGKREVVAVE